MIERLMPEAPTVNQEARRDDARGRVREVIDQMRAEDDVLNSSNIPPEEAERIRTRLQNTPFRMPDFDNFVQNPYEDVRRTQAQTQQQQLIEAMRRQQQTEQGREDADAEDPIAGLYGGRFKRKPGPGEILVPVRSQYGTTNEVPWPTDVYTEGINKMRRIIGDIEVSTDPRGGDVNQLELQDLQLIIQHYSESEDPNLKLLSHEMKEEFNARLAFHAAYLEFSHANDVKTVHAIAARLRANQMNNLFRLKDSMGAFNYYEDCGEFGDGSRRELFMGGTEEQKNTVREDIKIQLALDGKFINKQQKQQRQELMQKASNQELSQKEKEDLESINTQIAKIAWAQRLGERIWEFTGREAVHDSLRASDLSDLSKPPEFKNNDVGGGAFYMRRTVKYREWLHIRAQNERPVTVLLENVDLKTEDFLTSLPSQLLGTTRKALGAAKFDEYYDQYSVLYPRATLADIGKLIEKRITDDAAVTTANILGYKIEDVRKEKKNDKTGETVKVLSGETVYEYTWPSRQDLDLTRVKWDEIDFGRVFDEHQPMNYWGNYQLSEPDVVRSAMMKKPDGYLIVPTAKKLIELFPLLAYLSAGQYKQQLQLIENYVNWEKDGGLYGQTSIKPVDVDTIITELSKTGNFSLEEISDLRKKLHEDGMLYQARLFASYFSLGSAAWEAMKEFFSGITKQISRN